MRVQFTPTARLQFLSALAYIRQDNPPTAIRFRRKAESVLRRLEKLPDSGRVIPEFPELPYREVIVVPYRFFYRVEGRFVWIVAGWKLPLPRLLRDQLAILGNIPHYRGAQRG